MGGRDGSDKRLLRGFGGTLEEVSLSDEARNRDRAGLLVGRQQGISVQSPHARSFREKNSSL